MGVLVPVGELAAGLIGVTLDVFGPPAADVVDGAEDFFWRLLHREGGRKARVTGCGGGHIGASFLGPANMLRRRARAAIGGALRHLCAAATYVAGLGSAST